ncbi:nucleoside hydrolase isoform X2 [Megachile rotundata]|uniref:nucleoside hydrolase isoform X2 n=1 Tax=Megachile rotundata TaxID=143995 RepID=UPI003FD6BB4F
MKCKTSWPINFSICTRTMKMFNYKFIIPISLLLCGIRSSKVLEKLIINTDAGADDAMAILLILRTEGFKVLAITCSYGNTHLDNVATNVLKILTIANRSDIPVYKGADKPLLYPYNTDTFFGSDGLGDFNFTEKMIAKVDNSKHAAVALIDLVKQYPEEITLLSLAPLTNIATSIALEPNFLKYLKNHIILGSSVSGIGNVLPNIEFNFYQDPESNYITLNYTKTSILLPWDACKENTMPLDWRKNVLGKVNSTIMNFLNKAERISLSKSKSWTSADTMAAAIMLESKLITKSIVTNVSPVLDGVARGSVLVDYTNLTGRPENTKIVQSFNLTAYQKLLLRKLS